MSAKSNIKIILKIKTFNRKAIKLKSLNKNNLH